MSVSKDQKRGTWKIYLRYKDWTNETRIFTKRGFPTRREALEYERAFLEKRKRDPHMLFSNFVDLYLADKKPRLKYHTYISKVSIINDKIIPYFGKVPLDEIKSVDIIQWQNLLLDQKDVNGNGYSQTYLRTIQNQLSAIFNHACRFYGLKVNPSVQAGKMGKSEPSEEMLFWTKDEYMKFAQAMKDKPVSYYAFETLYWCGLRVGELLALTRGDFDLENRKLTINKSFQKIKGKEYITPPKTEKSNRVIDLPRFFCREMEDYFGMIYRCEDDTRLFNFTKSYLHHEMERGSKEARVRKIRVHDLRHSHVAYLIHLGFSPMEIADRMGHETMEVTIRYAHLYPSRQMQLVSRMEEDWENDENARKAAEAAKDLSEADASTENDSAEKEE